MHKESSNNKRIIKNTMMLYFRMIFIMIISLFTSRINLQSLGVEDFGIYNVVGGVVTMFSVFSGSLGISISRFITFELGKDNKERLHKVFSTAVTIQILLAVIITILAEILGIWFLNNKMNIPIERLDAANCVMHFSILSFAIHLLSIPYNAAIIAHEKMSAFAYVSVFEVIAKLMITYYLFISPFDKLKTYAILLFLLSIILRSIYGIYCKYKFQECRYKLMLDYNLFKEMTNFAGWSLFTMIAHTLYTQGLNILLNIFYGPLINAARGIAVQVQHAVQSFSKNFQMALNPQIIKSYAIGDIERMHSLIYVSSKFGFYMLYILSLPIIILTPQILTFWLGNFPEKAIVFVRLILIIITIDSLGSSIYTTQQATGNIKLYQVAEGSIYLLILPVSYFSLKLCHKPEIVYVVYLIVVLIAHLVRLFIIKRIISFSIYQYVQKVLIPIISVVTISLIAPVVCVNYLHNDLFSMLIEIIICVFSVLFSICICGLNKQEKSSIRNKLKIIGNKLMFKR